MIVRDHPGALKLLFVWRGSILPAIVRPLLILGVFSCLIAVLHTGHVSDMAGFSIAPFALLGVALSIFLGFRNQACYARWWEGRSLWGQMVGDVRSLVRASESLLGDSEGDHAIERRELLMWVQLHYHALRCELRSETLPDQFVTGWLSQRGFDVSPTDSKLSSRCLLEAGRVLQRCRRADVLDSIGVQTLDGYLARLASVQAGCERLASTPTPFAYRLLTHRTAYLYCFLLPFGLIGSMGWMTPLFTVILGYTFFGLDALAEELERPFDKNLNQLPLAALCRVNDISIAEGLGESPPPPAGPDRFYLD